jgi:hypothetical protein
LQFAISSNFSALDFKLSGIDAESFKYSVPTFSNYNAQRTNGSKILLPAAKLLTDQIDVNLHHGLLDDVDTEVLLAMRKEFEVRHEKQKKLRELRVINSETVSCHPL